MILELLILSLIVIFCLTKKSVTILLLLMILLPVHGTIKVIFFPNTGEVYSLWKEVAILIILIRVYKSKSTLAIANFGKWYCLWLVYVGIFLVYSLTIGLPFMGSLKQMIFPFLILFSISKMDLTHNDIKKILIYAGLGSVLINITGMMDFLSPSARLLFRDLMHVGYVYDSQGNIYYDTSSFAIMGVDRACGLMSGGPNQMGVYNSFVLLSMSVLLSHFKLTRRLKMCIYFITFLSVMCLLTSFSRAGMAIVAITYFIYFYKKKPIYLFRFLGILLLLAILIVIVSIPFPQIGEVLLGTFTGKEASSAQRGNMTYDAMMFVLQNPLGFGIGASVISHMAFNKYAAFAESALINMAIDLGVLGFVIMSFVYYKAYKCFSVSNNMLASLGASFIIANYITSFVSVNPYETPYVYLAWVLMGLFCVKIKDKYGNKVRFKS